MQKAEHDRTLLLTTRYSAAIFFGAAILYFGKTLFIPLSYSLLIAIVLYPICRKLENRGWPRSLAISLGLSIVALMFLAILALLVLQVGTLRKDIPELRLRLQPALEQFQRWLAANLGLSDSLQQGWWTRTLDSIGDNTGTWFLGLSNALFVLFLVPAFSALLLYNRRQFVQMLEDVCGPAYQGRLHRILDQTVHTYFQFIRGMIAVYFVVGVLNSIGLLALGIRHALLFGFLTAIMTIVPYVGIIISSLLPISVAWITHDSVWYPLGVVAVFGFVQYLEANVIFPRIVAARLDVSTFATLIAIIAGGILWGVSGMILFIPFIGILKIVSGQIPEWKSLNRFLARGIPATANKPGKNNQS